MPHNSLLLIILLLMAPNVFAEYASIKSRTRLGGTFGYGNADVTVSGESANESPGAFSLFYDYILDDRRIFGVEHMRSITYDSGTVSTAISFTGFYGKWYFVSPISQRLYSEGQAFGTYLVQKSISPYVAAGFGFGQSSLRDKVGDAQIKGSVGFYTAIKGGVELPLYKSLGGMFEAAYTTTVFGEGQIGMLTMMLGLFIYL